MAKKQTQRSSMRDAARKRAEERQHTGGGTKFIFPEGQKIEFFKPEKGKMKIDILPYEVTVNNHPVVKKGEMWYQRTIFVHNAIGAEEKAYLCLKTIGKRCPICDDRADMMKSPDGDENIIKQLAPKEREVFNIIDLNNEKAGVQLWEYSYHLFGKLLETEIRESDEDSGYEGHAELEGGKTLELRFKEKQMGKHKFLECDRIDFKDRDDYDDDILDDVLDLDAILNVYPAEKLSAIYFEQEEEEAPKSSKRSSEKDDDEPEEKTKRGSKGKAKPEPEDDKPTRSKSSSAAKGKGKAKDDEEEEDEKPTRASKSKKKEPEPEAEDDEGDGDDLTDLDREELEEIIEDEELDVTIKKKTTDDEIRDMIREAREEAAEAEKAKKAKKKEPAKGKAEPEKKPSKKKSDENEECPHEGTFGEDCDEFDECFDCPLWEECNAAKEALKPAKKKK